MWMSGWWFAAFAASATRFANAMAALKPLSTYVFVSALPSRRQPEPPSRSALRARSSSRFSLSGSFRPRAYRVRHAYGARWRCVILCSLRKLCEPTAGGTRRSAGDLSRKSGASPHYGGRPRASGHGKDLLHARHPRRGPRRPRRGSCGLRDRSLAPPLIRARERDRRASELRAPRRGGAREAEG